MSKTKMKERKPIANLKVDKSVNTDVLPQKYETWICIGVILLSLLIFYKDNVFKGKVFSGHDNVTSSIGSGVVENDVFPLWTPYIFAGMPSYGSLMTTGNRWFDFTKEVNNYAQRIFGTFLFKNGWLIFYYMIFGLGIFLFMRHKGHNKIVSTFTAMAIIYCTTVMGWAYEGHNTKVLACAFFPYILLFVDKLKEKMNWLYALALIIALHLEWESTHLQMTYYFYMFLGIYLGYSFLRNLKNKEILLGLLRSTAILIITTGLSFVMSADRYLSVYEYSKYSIRGASPIATDTKVKQSFGEDGSLDYEYATNWSFSPGEVMTFIIPSYYGFGNIDNYTGVIPFRQNGAKPNTYFGQMTMTNAPNYLGVLVLALAIIGFLYYRKDVFVQSLSIIGVFSLIVSFGRTFPVFYDLLFNYLPYFNKFRVPVMILILFEICMAILAGYGLTAIIDIYKKKNDEKNLKRLLYGTIVFGSLLLLALVAKSLFSDIYRGTFDSALKTNTQQIVTNFLNKYPEYVESEYTLIFSNMMKDLYFSLGFLTLFFGLSYFLVKRTINLSFFYLAVIVILIFDLWRVDVKPYDTRSEKEFASEFVKPPYIEFLEKDKSSFRVVEDGFPTQNTLASFGIQNIYGYSAAKLGIYRDAIENCFTPFLWNLLNTKYLLSDKRYSDSTFVPVYVGSKNDMIVYENKNCLPRAFFVNRYEVKDKLSIVNSLREGSFNPRDVAYLESDPGVKVDPIQPGVDAKVTSFGMHHIGFDVTATGNNLLFISEIYYPAGWKAYIDGQETPIYKTDYIFRSIVIPQGNHKIEMKFDPQSFKIGKQISLWTNIMVFGLIGFFGVTYFIRRKKKPGQN